MTLRFTKIIVLICLPLWIFIQEGSHSIVCKTKIIEHAVEVHHHGKGEYNIEKQTLFEVQNKKGLSVEFYMDVESVICFDSVCKVVSVRVFWNNLGEYKKYELEKGVTLEKYEADVFEKEDYKKLHKILSTIDSPFKNVHVDEILTVVDDAHLEDVDAVSGATALELDEDETVPGAALTCFTLWHWAHGDIKQIIRDISGKSFKETNFNKYLNKDDSKYQLFALEQLSKKGLYTNDLIESVIEKTTAKNELLKSSIKYFGTADTKNYFPAIEQLFVKGKKEQKIASLNSLLNIKLDAPKNYFDEFSKHVSKLESYQEVSTFLRLMKLKNPDSPEVLKQVIPLLERELLIARNAYWFLEDKNLNREHTKKLEDFYNQFKEQL